MTDYQETILLIRGAISTLPPASQERVDLALGEIRAVIAKYESEAMFAIALLGAEMQAGKTEVGT